MTGALDLFQAALAYAARDWPVFPCSPATKAPLIRAWRKRASTNPETIKAWWYRWPQAMIGLPTGRPTGVFVVDIDPGEAASAEAILGELERLVGPLPPGPRVRSPGGGLHIYFAMPAGIEIGNRAGVLPGVDVRGTGGYVIAPPSVRSDGIVYFGEAGAGLA